MQTECSFLGGGPFSKSLLTRALIVKSRFPDFQTEGENHCDDVRTLQKALEDFHKGKTVLHCGSGAAGLKFLAFRGFPAKRRVFFKMRAFSFSPAFA